MPSASRNPRSRFASSIDPQVAISTQVTLFPSTFCTRSSVSAIGSSDFPSVNERDDSAFVRDQTDLCIEQAAFTEARLQRRRFGRRYRDQQPAARLGITRQREFLVGDTDLHPIPETRCVAERPGRLESTSEVLARAVEYGDRGHADLRPHSRACAHLEQMTGQTVAGDVGGGTYARGDHGISGIAVECRHPTDRIAKVGWPMLPENPSAAERAVGSNENARADRLRQIESVPRPGRRVAYQFVDVYGPGHRQTVLRDVVDDGVAAGDGKAGFGRLFGAPFQDLFECRKGEFVRRKGGDGQAEHGRRAHGVDGGDGVCRGDRPEQVRVVDDGREKVDGLGNGQVAHKAHHGRIVVRSISDEEIPEPLLLWWKMREHRMQVILTQLARSTACRCKGGEGWMALDLRLHGLSLSRARSMQRSRTRAPAASSPSQLAA